MNRLACSEKTRDELAIKKLRTALAAIIGCDGRADLEQMKVGLKMVVPPNDRDRSAALNAVDALLETLPDASMDKPR